MKNKFVSFDAEGLRYEAVIGVLDQEEAQETGGNLYFSFGNRSRTMRGWFFPDNQWPSPSYYMEKMYQGTEYPNTSEWVVGYMVLMALTGHSHQDIVRSATYMEEAYREYAEAVLERGTQWLDRFRGLREDGKHEKIS